jgi:hypothetical protein
MPVLFSDLQEGRPADRFGADNLTSLRLRARNGGQFDGGISTVSGGTVGALEAAGANRLGA